MIELSSIADALDKQKVNMDAVSKKLRVCLTVLDGVNRAKEVSPCPNMNIKFTVAGYDYQIDVNDIGMFEDLASRVSGYVDDHNKSLVAIMEEIISVRKKDE